jgi:hypothetical protein
MVKYYFQLLNGELKYVAHGSKQDLKDRLDADFKQDTIDAIEALKKHNETAREKIDNILQNYPSDEGERLEADCLVAQLKNAIYRSNKEIERVSKLQRENLVFFEFNQIIV